MNTASAEIRKHLKHNLVANLLDGAFFGMALGFASFVTVLPLFVSTLTDSAMLIGLIPAIHSMGWQLPQLLTADRVSRQRRFKPMVLSMTIHERLPFFGLALVAWSIPFAGTQVALGLTFAMLVWQGFGGGFAAAPWQSMIGKIIPSDRRGTFFGAQSAAANLLSSGAAVIAGAILENLESPLDFVLNFLLAGAGMGISFFFLSKTREPESPAIRVEQKTSDFWLSLGRILRSDRNFRAFLGVRMLSQLTVMGTAFYTVYAVQHHGMSEMGVGLMTAVLLGAQIIVNPLLGWIGDRFSHRTAMEIGIAAGVIGALVAWWAPGPTWFYLVFVMTAITNAAIWTVGLAFIQEFGTEPDRPAYIGLSNTLIAPATILAPLFGGWLAELSGYTAAFLASAVAGVATLAVLHFMVQDPRRLLPAAKAEGAEL